MTLIRSTLEAISERDEAIANTHSSTTAQLCKAVYNYLGVEDIEAYVFLPFPDSGKSESTGLQGKITKETAIAFRDAVKNGEIPSSKVGAFYKYLDDIETLTQ